MTRTRVGGTVKPKRMFAVDTPLVALFALFPLWWVLGLGEFIWVLAAIPMAFWLLRKRDLRVPRGLGLWILFLIWMLFSALALEQFTHYVAFAYRAGVYLAATVVFLFVYNSSEEEVATARLLKALLLYFAYVVIGGYLGLIFPNATLTTPMELILPGSLTENQFVFNMVHPIFAQVQDFIGFPLPRPAAPFIFTNEWGANMALLVPCVFAAAPYLSSRGRLTSRILLGLSIVPIVVSVNRGLWVSLIVVFLYVAARLALRGQLQHFRWIIAGVAVVALLVFLTPLNSLVSGRLESAHSDSSRLGLYAEVQNQIAKSPLIGFGAPRANDNPNQPAVGTHGQFWMVLFSHGIPAAILFIAFFVSLATRTGKARGPWLWLHAVVVLALVEMWFYGLIPGQLQIVLIAGALVLRHQQTNQTEEMPEEQHRRPTARMPSKV